MSIYSTQSLSREKAIEMLESLPSRKIPSEMTNDELEEELFNRIGAEWNENSPLHYYAINS